jgi:hypothetical protein
MKKISLLFVLLLISISCKEKTETPELKTQKTEIPEVVYSKSEHTLQAFDLTEVLKYNGIASLDIGEELPDLKTLEKEGLTLRRDVYRTAESSFDVIYLNKYGKDIIRCYPDITHIFMITILGPEAVPENMIKPTNVFADLKETYPNAAAVGSVMQGDVFVRQPDATFRLDAKNKSPTIVQIPENTVITEITVQIK